MKTLLMAGLLLTANAHAADIAPATPPAPLVNPDPVALGKYAFDAARAGDTALLRELLTRGAPLNAQDERGNTALILAAYHGHTDTVDTLLAAGADPNIGDSRGNTALMGTLFKGNSAVAERLLADPRINVNVRNQAGQTAAMFAALFGREAMLDKLAALGADFSATDARGVSAEQLASQQGNDALAVRISALSRRSQ